MITFYKNNPENILETVDEPIPGSWIHVLCPETEEIDQLVNNLGIPRDYLTYPLDKDERARTEKDDDGVIFILLRVPVFQGEKSDIPFVTIPLGLIITEKHIITVCRERNSITDEFCAGKIKALETNKRNRFVLRLLLLTANFYLNYLREINKRVDIIEDKLTASLQNRELLDLLRHQKSLVYFTEALKANELMMERLQKGQLFKKFPDDEDLLEDVITENQQAIEMVNISNSILSGMMDAFASIISNNLNVVMKFLTSITIVLTLPTMITSFFGMNVRLPTDNFDLAYVAILGGSILLMVLVVFVFVKRDWF